MAMPQYTSSQGHMERLIATAVEMLVSLSQCQAVVVSNEEEIHALKSQLDSIRTAYEQQTQVVNNQTVYIRSLEYDLARSRVSPRPSSAASVDSYLLLASDPADSDGELHSLAMGQTIDQGPHKGLLQGSHEAPEQYSLDGLGQDPFQGLAPLMALAEHAIGGAAVDHPTAGVMFLTQSMLVQSPEEPRPGYPGGANVAFHWVSGASTQRTQEVSDAQTEVVSDAWNPEVAMTVDIAQTHGLFLPWLAEAETMATSSDESKTSVRVQKRGKSLQRKTVQLGKLAGGFSATVYWHPRLREYQGAIHVPKGQSIPDVSQLLLDLYHGREQIDCQRRSQPTQSAVRHQRRESTPVLDETAVEASKSESQKLPTDVRDGKDTGTDLQLASGADQHDAEHLATKAVTAGWQGSLVDAVYNLADNVSSVDNADVDADGSPEEVGVSIATCNGAENDHLGDLMMEGTCEVESGCRPSTDGDFDWSGLEWPEWTENEPAMSDWLVVDVGGALETGGPGEDAGHLTLGNMQTENMGQRRLFECVSEHLWRANRDGTAAEIAAEGGSSDGDGVLVRSRDVSGDDCKQRAQPNTAVQGSTELMASPTAAGSGVDIPMQHQAHFFQALALQFYRQSQAGTARN
ncbi:hypothetical protein CSUB01_09608 [Colletotrichum sublineola]|uniref:Uncharacterized protein n=1 Tax=Colletotrichum sublineola TaxID=1173701 RepID=A0A066Y0X2_COLSU|nr:hypothetical protein CSUB01_09608 [Colletotrichum sublineola]